MIEWKSGKIRDLGRVVTGSTPPTKNPELFGGVSLFITPSDLDYDSWRIHKSERSISQAGCEKFRTRMIPAGSIMYTCIASIGKIGIAAGDVLTNQQINSIVPYDDVDGRFVYYLLRNETQRIQNLNAGCAVPIINKGDFENIDVSYPSLSTQKRIADILSAYDDLIENNRRRMEILEESARLIYRKMFGSKKKRTKLLHLGDFVERTISGDWGKESSDRKCTEKIMCLRGADIPSLRYRDFGKGIVRFVTLQHVEERAMKDGDLFVEMSGGSPTQATGRVGFMSSRLLRDAELPVLCTNFCRVIRPKSGYAFFLYLAWLDLYDQDLMFMFEHSAIALKNFDLDLFLKKILVVKPEDSQLRDFNEKIAGVMDQMDVLGGENRRLIKARDILLPKLMSGELEARR